MTYMTAEELELPQWVYDGLLSARNMLNEGHIRHISFDVLADQNYSSEPKDVIWFNMAHWAEKFDCGTVCCIGGLIELITNAHLRSEVIDGWRGLERLFYPPGDMKNVSISKSLRAIDNYLTIGHPQWYDVLELG